MYVSVQRKMDSWIIVLILVYTRIPDTHAMLSTEDYRTHSCVRTCQVNSRLTCEYDFYAESFYTLTKACYNCPYNVTDCYRPGCIPADGNSRAILVINRMLPGPAIHVCEGDTVLVNVHNKLNGHGMGIHWHGILQRGTPYMDGVGMLTQCPIPEFTSFQYRFNATDPGTHYWHGHTGQLRSDGIFGAFVVRQAAEREVHHGLYDYDLIEHTMIVNDWLLELTLDRFANHHQANGDNKPASMLINGMGAYRVFFDSDRNENITTPHSVFNVERGRRYRFRIISNGILNCPIQLSIDNHTLRVISSDGNPFRPVDVQSLNIFAGERYDVVVLADQDVGSYWIRARGQADCNVKSAFQQAILRYNGTKTETPSLPTGHQFGAREGKKLNPWNKKATDMLIPVSHLENLRPSNEALKETPDKQFYLAMDFNNIDNFNFYVGPEYVSPSVVVEAYNQLLSPQINYISNAFPAYPPLSQFDDIPQDMFCNADTKRQENCNMTYCECLHTLKVDLNDVVELIVIDEGKVFNANHPMHLHGYKFKVIGMDRLNDSTTLEEVQRLDNEGRLIRNFTSPVDKDTVTVPDGGYVILRIHANNPGFWFMHCHIEFHANIGMGVILQVGEPNQMPRKPKNFPRCGNWRETGEQPDGSDGSHCTNTASVVHRGLLHVLVMLSLCILLA